MTRNHTPNDIRELLFLATAAPRAHRSDLASVLDLLVDAPGPMVDHQAESTLLILVDAAYNSGWQPAELARQGRLGATVSISEQLVRDAIAIDHARRRPLTYDSTWVAQLESLALGPIDHADGWITRRCRRHCLERRAAIAAMVDAIANLRSIPRLDPIVAPPGADDRVGAARRWRTTGQPNAESNPVLDRIRNLLAKAESTTFEAEATAFTAKAHELMTRHAIDSAFLQGGLDRSARPISIRLAIDPPYFKQKSGLLHAVAVAGRCRAIALPSVAMATVVGYSDDVAAVELLFTSLLVQAQSALTATSSDAPTDARTRSRLYRSSFLAGFAHRIAVRLTEINDSIYGQAEAHRGSSFLPVLASRAETIDAFIAERFGVLVRSRPPRDYDWAGWSGGTVAANNARVTSGVLSRP